LREALSQGLGLVFVPALLAFPLGLIGEVVLGQGSHICAYVWQTGLGLSLLAVAWWCRGLFALSNQLLSGQRLYAGFFTFMLAFQLSWMLLTDWAPNYLQLVFDSAAARRPDVRQIEAWENRPMHLLAQPQLHRLVMSGDIGWGSAAALERALAEHPQTKVLELESYGGFVHESNLLVNLVQLHGLDTLVRGRCDSACTEVFLAGRDRYIGPQARFGFHQSGYQGRADDTQWSSAEYESSIFYRAQGVSADFTAQALNTSYYGLWRPQLLEVKRAHFATHWWSERPAEYG
jgi:hypothetical protein